jgi:hypothetical protein
MRTPTLQIQAKNAHDLCEATFNIEFDWNSFKKVIRVSADGSVPGRECQDDLLKAFHLLYAADGAPILACQLGRNVQANAAHLDFDFVGVGKRGGEQLVILDPDISIEFVGVAS